MKRTCFFAFALFLAPLLWKQPAISAPRIELIPERLEIEGHLERGNPNDWMPVIPGMVFEPDFFTIRNSGDEVLRIDTFFTDVEWFGILLDEYIVAPGATRQIPLGMDIVERGEYDAVITIRSNDPDRREVQLPVHFVITHPEPAIWLELPIFNEINVWQGEVRRLAGSLSYDGDDTLRFALEIQAGREPDDDERPPVVSIEPDEGRLLSGEMVELILTIDAHQADRELYAFTFSMFTNDPDESEFFWDFIVVILEPEPDIEVRPRPLRINLRLDEFGERFLPSQFQVLNLGSDTLIVERMTTDLGIFRFTPANFSLPPDNRRTVEIFIEDLNQDLDLGESVQGRISIFSNDPDEEEYRLTTIVHNPTPPSIHIEPMVIDEWMFTGAVDDFILTITNEGETPLVWTSEIEIILEPGDDGAVNRSLRSVYLQGQSRDEPLDWLAIEPAEGEVLGGQEMTITLTLNARDAIGGEYEADVHFFSNDPANPDVWVTVIMRIEEPFWIPVEWSAAYGYPEVLDFNRAYNEMFAGEEYRLPIRVSNYGRGNLNIEEIESDNRCFRVEPNRFVLEPNRHIDAAVIFAPEDVDEYRGILTFISDDRWVGGGEVFVRGAARDIPGVRHFRFGETEANHSILVTSVGFDGDPVPTGWEVGVFTPAGLCAGGGVWARGDSLGFPAWGDDPQTQEIDGFRRDERISFRLWDNENDQEYQAAVDIAEGSSFWAANELTILSLGWPSPAEEWRFSAGWNIISLNIIPPQEFWIRDEGPDVRRLFQRLRINPDDPRSPHHIIILKDDQGRFYAPAFNEFCNIPYFDLTKGYQVKVNQAVSTTFTGQPIAPDAEIPLHRGWNIIAYYPNYELSVAAPQFYVLSPIIDNVLIAKDGAGRFMAPRLGFSNMLPWRPTQGYQVKVDVDVVLNYPAQQMMMNDDDDESGAVNPLRLTVGIHSVHFRPPEPTGRNMSLLLNLEFGIWNLECSEVGVVTKSGLCVGASSSSSIGLAVWGDDLTTEAIDGAVEGEALDFIAWDGKQEYECEARGARCENSTPNSKFQISNSTITYKTDGFAAVDLDWRAGKSVLPAEFALFEPYPNPFNSATCIRYALPEAAPATLQIMDIAGRESAVLFDGWMEAGRHRLMWEAEGQPAGIYFAILTSQNETSAVKMVLLK